MPVLAHCLEGGRERPTGTGMRHPVLAGYDPRARDRAPVAFGVTAARLTGAPLIVAAVETGAPVLPISAGQSLPYAVAQTDSDLLDDCKQALDEIEADLEAESLPVRCVRLRSTSAARALHEAAEHEDAGLLVAGAGRGAGLGSTAERLIHGAPCPVALVPRDWAPHGELTTIGVGYVDSEEGREALRGAYALARRASARLRVLTVVKPRLTMNLAAEAPAEGRFGKPVEDVEGEYMLQAERQARAAVGELGDDLPVEVEVLVGDPAEILADFSGHLDLLVCGSRAYGPLRAVLLGSVSRRLADTARCPVVVLPRGVRASLESLVAEAVA
jgi:nucleotide-binding universal stress UspA family protein